MCFLGDADTVKLKLNVVQLAYQLYTEIRREVTKHLLHINEICYQLCSLHRSGGKEGNTFIGAKNVR